jgi:hypothetical protein
MIMKVSAINKAVSGMIEWVERTNAIYQEGSKSIKDYHLPHVALYFPDELLNKVHIVPIDQLPIPHLSLLGFKELTDFEQADSRAITLDQMYYIKPSCVEDEKIHFHELIHVLQWQILGKEKFLFIYGLSLLQFGYSENPLEVMARRYTDLCLLKKKKVNLVESIIVELNRISCDMIDQATTI